MPLIRECVDRGGMMIRVPVDLNPMQLMNFRFKAQSESNFEAIYHSSHRLSTLRRSFLSLKQYINFASEQLSGQIKITAYDLLLEQVLEKKAYVLCKVSMTVQGEVETFVEVAELQRSVLGWRFLHCARLPLALFPNDLMCVDLKLLFSHPEATVY